LKLRAKPRLARPPRGSDADIASPDPLGLGRKVRLARPPEAQTQTPPRSIPSASGISYGSSDPSRARAPNAAPPDQDKASDSRRPYPRRDRHSDSHITAGHGGDYSNHPGHCSLTSFTMQPYLFYCGVLPHSKRGMEEINQCHYLLSSPTVNRTGNRVTDPTPTTPTGLGNPPQEQPYCQPCFKDGMGKLLQGQDCHSSTRQGKSPNPHVNTCLPLRL
jgi:hypothetical protein